MYVLLTVRSIFSKPEEGPAVPAGTALDNCASGPGEGTLGGHGAGDGDGDGDAPGDPLVPHQPQELSQP